MSHFVDRILVAFVLLAAYTYPLDSASTRRILNGHEVPAQDDGLKYPFMVGVFEKHNDLYNLYGGGSIVHQSYVLSAAHVVSPSPDREFYIQAGSLKWSDENGTNTQFIRAYPVIDPTFDNVTVQHDIAVLRLDQPLEFNNYVNKIDMVGTDYVATGNGTIMGWGMIFNPGSWDEILPEYLMETDIPISDFTECNTRMKGLLNETNQICLGYHHPSRSCMGDSGGPFIQDVDGVKNLVGVMSIGVISYVNGTNKPVCVGELPMAVTKIASHRDFIDSVINNAIIP